MDNDQILPSSSKNATKNDGTRPTQVFVLPPELLKGLFLQNKIPKVNNPIKLDTVTVVNMLNNDDQEEKKGELLPDSLVTINNKNNEVRRKNDATLKKSIQDSSLNTDKQKKEDTSVDPDANQELIKKIEQSPSIADKTKHTRSTTKTKLTKDSIAGIKDTSSRRITKTSNKNQILKITDGKQNIVNQDCYEQNDNNDLISVPEKLVYPNSNKPREIEDKIPESNTIFLAHTKDETEGKNIDKTCVQSDKPNLQSTDEASIRRSRRRISENFKVNEVITVSDQKSKDTDKQTANSSKNEFVLDNNSILISNKPDAIVNIDRSSTEISNISSNTAEVNQTRFSRRRRIAKIVTSKSVNQSKIKLNTNDVKFDKEQINVIDETQSRYPRRNRISRISSEVLNVSTHTQKLKSNKKDDCINSVSDINCLELNAEITNKLFSMDEPSNVINSPVQNNETIAKNTVTEKKQNNIDIIYSEAKNSGLDINNEASKTLNETNYSSKKRISKIPKTKNVVAPIQALNDKIDIKSQNKNTNFHISQFPQKSCSNTIIEKYKTKSTEKLVDDNLTLETDLEKGNISQSHEEIENLSLNNLDKSSETVEKQTRYSGRRISKIPNLAKIDKGLNDKSKAQNQNKEEVKSKIFDNCTNTCTKELCKVSTEQIHSLDSNESKEIINNIENDSTIEIGEKIGKTSKNCYKTLTKSEANHDEGADIFNESKQVSTSESQGKSVCLTDVSPLRYSRRKRITRISKPSEITNSMKIKQRASNTSENETHITINDLSTEYHTSTELVEKSLIKTKMTQLIANESSEVDNNITQTNQALYDARIPMECITTDRVGTKTDIVTNDLSIENCCNTEEMVEKLSTDNSVCINSKKSSEVENNINQNIEVISSTTDAMSMCVFNILDKRSITEPTLKTQEKSAGTSKSSYNENFSTTFDKEENCQESLAFQNESEEIEIIEEIEYIIEEVLDEENAEASNDIIVYDTINSDNCVIQNSPNKYIVASTCKNEQVPNNLNDFKLIKNKEVPIKKIKSPVKNTLSQETCKNNQEASLNNHINSKLIGNKELLLDKRESSIQNTLLKAFCENNQETNLNSSIYSELNVSNEIILNKNKTEKNSVYSNRKKIQNNSYSNDSNPKSEEPIKEIEKVISVTDPIRKYSTRSQQTQKLELKTRNRRKSANQITSINSNAINTRSHRTSDILENSNKDKNEYIKISNIEIIKNKGDRNKSTPKLKQKIEEISIANEVQINLNYEDEEENVTIDIKNILDSLTMDNSQDDSLLLQNNTITNDEKINSIEENVERDLETICEYNFNTFTNKGFTENIQFSASNKSQNIEKEKLIDGEVNTLKSDILQSAEKTISNSHLEKVILLTKDDVEDKKKEKIFTYTDELKMESSIQSVKRTNLDDSLEKNEHELIINKVCNNKVTNEIIKAPENTKPVNSKFNENADKYSDNNKISASANVNESKDKLDSLDARKVSEINDLTKSNEDAQIQSNFKPIIDEILIASKESEGDNSDDNYDSMNISFGNDDCSSISSVEDSNLKTTVENLPSENLRNLEFIDQCHKNLQDDEFTEQIRIESQKSDANELNETINNNVQIEQSELVISRISNIYCENLSEGSNLMESTSIFETKHKSLRFITDYINADTHAGSKDTTFYKGNSEFNKQKIKELNKSKSELSSLIGKISENTSETSNNAFTSTDQAELINQDSKEEEININLDEVLEKKFVVSEETKLKSHQTENRNQDNLSQIQVTNKKIPEKSNSFISEQDTSSDKMEITNQDTKGKTNVFKDNDNLDKVPEKIMILSEESKIECNETEKRNQGNLSQINIANNKTSKPSNSFISERDIRSNQMKTITSEVQTSDDEAGFKNNSLLECSNLIDNSKTELKNTSISAFTVKSNDYISEEMSPITKSNNDVSEIEGENKMNADVSIPSTTTGKRRRGRPPKSAMKVNTQKSEVDNDIIINNRRQAKQGAALRSTSHFSEQQDHETTTRKRRSYKISSLELRRSTRSKTDENSKKIHVANEKISETSKWFTSERDTSSDQKETINQDNDEIVNFLGDVDTVHMLNDKINKTAESNTSDNKAGPKNNSLLESNNFIDNSKTELKNTSISASTVGKNDNLSEETSPITESNIDVSQIEGENKLNKDVSFTSTTSVVKRKRGRPPKSARKINVEKNKVENSIKINNKRQTKQESVLRNKFSYTEEKDPELITRKRRSCRSDFLKEPTRFSGDKIDGNLEEIENSSRKQLRQRRQSSNKELKSLTFEEKTIHNDKDKDDCNKLLSKNTLKNEVKKRRGRAPKLNREKTSSLQDQKENTLLEDKSGVLSNTRKRKRSIKNRTQEAYGKEFEDDSMVAPNKTPVEEENDDNEQSECNDSSNSDTDENVTCTVKTRKGPLGPYKRRRRGKQRCGRPKGIQRKSICDNDYIPHHSHRRRKGEVVKSESVSESNVKKIMSCGKCDKEITKSQWLHHNLMIHNNTSWIKGTTKPDFENDDALLKRIITMAHKKRKKTLICEQCQVIKRSVAGYFSHLTFCGKSEEEMQALMVTCPVCQAVIKPSSLEYHERLHRMEADQKERMPELNIENIDVGPRGKRKAAEKAITKISDITAMVKDDKENCGPAEKKLKLNISMKKIIKRPQMEKRIPSTVISKWRKNLDNGQNACCSQPGCDFSSNSYDEIKSHYSICNFTPQENFICKLCRFQSLTKQEILEHALENHSLDDDDANLSLSDTDSSSSDNLSENEESNKINSQGVTKKFIYKESNELKNKLFKFIFKNGICHSKFTKTYLEGFQWTLQFERENYQFSLFEEFSPNNFIFLNSKESRSYLPELDQSMPVMIVKAGIKTEIQPEWKTWKRFEGQCIEDNPTFFVGGPVWALAWLPVPTSMSLSQDLSQFIAVSTHTTMDAEYSIGESYYGKNIIQIWNAGNLNHKTDSQCNPKLAYAITHEGGTVWCLEWCPSGCYQHEDLLEYTDNKIPNRMGLLAAGCSDGCVRIYSLIFPEYQMKENFENSNEYPIYSTDPVLMLVINKNIYNNKRQKWQVTKLSWSKEKNHNIIAAGFSNGYVALWNLTTKSPLLKTKKGCTTYLSPYRHFFAHHHAVTMVHLIPQDNKRFVATASLDRLFKLWDLEDLTSPKNSFKKSFVTDGAWLNHWCTAFVTYDDALSLGHNYSYCLPLRDYTYKYFNIFPTNSPSFSIATSDYGNSIANGTVAGEILAIFPQQMIYIRDMEKTLPRKRYISMISTAEIVDFGKIPDDVSTSKNKKDEKDAKAHYDFMPASYEDSKDRFGVKFYDKLDIFRNQCMANPKNQKKTLTIEMMKQFPVEQYPFTSVNTLSWNPNASSFLWLAAGYQNGFVRLMSFKSMASPVEWNKLLTSHIQTLKSDSAKSQSTKLQNR